MHFPNADDCPPLVRALWDNDFTAAVKLMQSGVVLDDILEEDGDSFLHRAVEDGDVSMITFFLQHGCPLTLASFDYVSHTPLIWAASRGRMDILKLLIAAGADVNAHNEDRIGNTAIREAVRGGYSETVRVLLDAGADPTIPGWMQISAVDQAYDSIEGGLDSPNARAIQKLLAKYPTALRNKLIDT